MIRFIGNIMVAGLTIFFSCSSDEPTQPVEDTGLPVLNKMVAIGNSLTAGVQSGGLVDDFQLNSYPYLIAQQMGKSADFQQPLIAKPGVGEIDSSTGMAYGPLKFENNLIVRGDPVPGGVGGLQALLTNALLPRAYDNLGLPGADLNDILNATGGGLYDAILRNPFFGNTTALQQARSLNPSLILLWAGNNDILGAALDGGNPALITPLADFRSRYVSMLDELSGIRDSSVVIIAANIPNVSDIAYVNLLDGVVYRPVPVLGIGNPVPVVFDFDFQPVLFDCTTTLYLPLLTEETEIAHVLLPFLSEYLESGLGIPDSAAMVGLGLNETQAGDLVQAIRAAGLPVSGRAIPGSLTITSAEEAIIETAVSSYNLAIREITQQRNIPMIDANAKLNELNVAGLDGYTGKFVLFDAANTAFSLDGVHPNNGGYAIVANAFIDKLNSLPDVSIPRLNTADFKGQYTGMIPKNISRQAARQAKDFFVR